MITEAHGNLLEADVDALVNTVNTTGVMGKGIALQFRRTFPEMFKAYERAAKAGDVCLGRMHVWESGSMARPKLVINFPTKGHWKARSRLADIQAGLEDLVRVVEERGIESIALPPLGCGNGGLEWRAVEPLIRNAFDALPDVTVHVFAPEGAPAAAQMATNTRRPNLTVGRAALVDIVQRYGERSFEVSLIEVQKLMYFLQAAGQDLKLNYEKGRYGPYADNLRFVLRTIEGHYLVGYGDGSKPVQSGEPLVVLPGAAEEARRVLEASRDTIRRIDDVLALADGFESAYAMELLATVHWVATVDDPGAATDCGRVAELVASWSPRKQGMFGADHVGPAWERLRDDGWLERRAVR